MQLAALPAPVAPRGSVGPFRLAARRVEVRRPVNSLVVTSFLVRRPVKTFLFSSLLGLAVSVLNWRTPEPGIGWCVADLVLVASIVAGVARGQPGSAGWLLAAANVWLAGASCRYASDWAAATTVPGMALTLALLAAAATARVPASAVGRIGHTCAEGLRQVPSAIIDAARVPRDACGPRFQGDAIGLLRGALVGVPLAGFFVLLLSADGRFRDTLGVFAGAVGDIVEFVIWTGATTAALIVAMLVLREMRRSAGLDAAPPRFAAAMAYRTAEPALADAPTIVNRRESALTWGVVLAHVVAVFGLYALGNLKSFFVGHALVRARGTTTYAAYVHQGFAQVSLATLLAVTCVVVGRILFGPPGQGNGRAPSPAGEGRAIVALELALLFLVSIALASCAHRLALYEEAYGYTYLRLSVQLMQLGIAGFISMTAARCLARSWRGWGTAVFWAGIAFVVIAGSIDADGWIAARNVARARAGARLDVEYLSTLSEDARDAIVPLAALSPGDAALLASVWADKQTERRARGWRARRGL
ncbi:MAG: DUF4173 domain-containing protein [Polyangiaceae bacterium]|nr:DUF4173 domain-containing protein [Polyangiaceae bacterium]